jgi:hypothetical protein
MKALTLPVLLALFISCSKSSSDAGGLTGTWSFRHQVGSSGVPGSLGGNFNFETVITDNSIQVSFLTDGHFNFSDHGIQTSGSYTFSDSTLTILPDSAAFADLCFTGPTLVTVTGPGTGPNVPNIPYIPPYHTPGILYVAILSRDSLQLNAIWSQPGNNAPDTAHVAVTGFRRM